MIDVTGNLHGAEEVKMDKYATINYPRERKKTLQVWWTQVSGVICDSRIAVRVEREVLQDGEASYDIWFVDGDTNGKIGG